MGRRYGAVAEWLGRGLQSLVQQFESARRLLSRPLRSGAINAPTSSRWSAGALGLCAAIALLATGLPTFEVAIQGYSGGANDQRTFDYTGRLTPLTEMWPEASWIVLPALALLGLSLAALHWGSSAWLVLPACLVALLCLRGAFDIESRLVWAEMEGVIGYEQAHGGVLLQPSLDDLKARARSSREARDPRWELVGGEHGYRARGLEGWWLLWRTTMIAALLGAYRAARLWFAQRYAIAITAVASLAVVVWLLLEGLGGLR